MNPLIKMVLLIVSAIIFVRPAIGNTHTDWTIARQQLIETANACNGFIQDAQSARCLALIKARQQAIKNRVRINHEALAADLKKLRHQHQQKLSQPDNRTHRRIAR
ncbi:MAG: hypothetical protein KF908_10555 [Nitrosomonas sp.]|uniref:Uncharacterized protein n=1 Tax=Nitrosomonas aestuarii TaxID=52441 RepID=A0A1I4DG83_9PROT|nr:hypothetical protein [Nitrosomonas aestuarii]MBX3630324.1 hypothetical protein [Nitrosomonas sp.]SFK91800.1 hypothetical protein SAMN05216302_10213 [Nitrosomonas aestuarii]